MLNKNIIKLSSDDLDRIWSRWTSLMIPKKKFYGGYKFMVRNYGDTVKFEEWLFTHGAVVKQENGNRHLEFSDEELCVLFVLEWL